MSLTEKKLRFTIRLAQGAGTNQPNTFSPSGTDTVTIEGLRASAQILNVGAPVNGRANVRIWGINESLMNQLSTLGLVFNIVPANIITIAAGDDEAGMSNVFSGTIFTAYGDYTSQPNVPFLFDCIGGAAQAVSLSPPTSFSGTANVADLISGFARQLGYGFENNGVTNTLENPYFDGSLWTQLLRCKTDANIGMSTENNLIAIWPQGGNRSTPNVPVISKETGMIGYPAFTQNGVIVKSIFRPDVALGSLIKIESDVLLGIQEAQTALRQRVAPRTVFPSQWAINKLDLDLSEKLPGGSWELIAQAYNPNLPRPIIQQSAG